MVPPPVNTSLALLRGGPADGIAIRGIVADHYEYEAPGGRVHSYLRTDDKEPVGTVMLTVWQHQGEIHDPRIPTVPEPPPPSKRSPQE